MTNIYLIGFMGTGKTAAGRELARAKKWQFMDLDDLIQLREKRSIAQIFAEEGEPYFRRVEKRALQEIAREKNFVVATGGGIVMDKENIRVMKETGTIICLSAQPEVILKRTCGQRHRPLLNVSDPKKQIEVLLKLRAPYYAQADKTIDTSRLSVEEVVRKLLGAAPSGARHQVARRKSKVKSKKSKVQGKRKN
ncbi:MAG: shikimate kinase [Candidatus Omnitrophica bacterium]|nr:shikimate kinase [Candidatus Omnitrophota bacterium]